MSSIQPPDTVAQPDLHTLQRDLHEAQTRLSTCWTECARACQRGEAGNAILWRTAIRLAQQDEARLLAAVAAARAEAA